MYTYSSFEVMGTFTLLRPVFYTLLMASILLLVFILIPKLRGNLLSTLTVISFSILTIVAAGQLLFYDAIIVDELNLGGDSAGLIMFCTIVVLGFLNPVIFLIKTQKSA